MGNNTDDPRIWKEKYLKAQEYSTHLQERIRELLNKIEIKEQEKKELLDKIEYYQKEIDAYKEALKREEEEIKQLKSQMKTRESGSTSAPQQSVNPYGTTAEMLSQREETREPMIKTPELPPLVLDLLELSVLKEIDPENPLTKKLKNQLLTFLETSKILELRVLSKFVKRPGETININQLQAELDGDITHALHTLVEKKLISKIGSGYIIAPSKVETRVPLEEWGKLNVNEIFEELKKIIEVGDNQSIVEALNTLRDVLMEKDIPASSIFFSIRQLLDDVKRGSITKLELRSKVHDLHERVKSSTAPS